MILLAAMSCRGSLTGELAFEVDVTAARVCETETGSFLRLDWLIASNQTCAGGASLSFDEACDALLEWGEVDCGRTGSGMAPLLPNVADIVSGSAIIDPGGLTRAWTWDCEATDGRELSLRTHERLREDDIVYRFEEPDLLEGAVVLELCPK